MNALSRPVAAVVAILGVGGVAVLTAWSLPTAVAAQVLLLAAGAGAGGAVVVWSIVAARLDAVTEGLDRSVSQASSVRRELGGRHAIGRLAAAADAAGAALRHVTTAATTDTLTQVANRSALVAQLAFELERAKRHARPLSVAFIDIDRFKSVNDTYGHQAGDAVLRAVARLIHENIRMVDTFGRYGGEEFLLVLPESEPMRAAETAERLRQLVMRERIDIGDGRRLAVTVSIGVAGGRGRDLTLESVVRDADAAMYSAKTLGRNQVYVFETPSEDGVVLRAPVDPAARALGRQLGQAAREVAEARLSSTVRDLGPAAQPGPYVVSAATDVAREMGMSDSEIETVRIAALFHDAGMAIVPEEVLDRPRPLDGEAWQQVRQHPRVSQLMLEEASRLRDAAEIVLHHHERFAGHGYPHGLHGSEIPIGSRILAVADAYQAMREDRPHRRAMSHDGALAEIVRHAGTQFDPQVATLFCRLFEAAPPERAEVLPPDEIAERIGRAAGSPTAARAKGRRSSPSKSRAS